MPDLLEELVEYACHRQVIDDLFDDKEILAAKLMNCFVPPLSIVNERFHQQYAQNPEWATDYFYALSTNSNYIQPRRVSKNMNYKARTEYGELDITINLSKPEKIHAILPGKRQCRAAINQHACSVSKTKVMRAAPVIRPIPTTDCVAAR